MSISKMVAVTHSGIFHADEVMAAVILRELFDGITIMRSRDRSDFDHADIVFDVGDGEFDHHNDMKEFRENGVPYAACGLIWRAYGMRLIRKYAQNLSSYEIEEVFYSIDETLIESIDAVDNGHPMDKTEVHMPTLDQLVKGFNPNWNSDLDTDQQFAKAMDFCKPILLNALDGAISAVEAEKVVMEAYDNREVENILVLDRFCPWKRHLRNYDEDESIIYVIFKDLVKGYRVQAVSQVGSRESIKPLPAHWAGKDAQVINELVDIDDAIFVHPGRFIAGTESLDSAMKMAELALIY